MPSDEKDSDSPSRLLARIARGRPSQAGEVASIVAHLRQLLNTRRNAAPSSPGYGLLDLMPLLGDLPGSRAAVCERLRATIVANEPRLTNVRVTFGEALADLTLQFYIDARLARSATAVALTTRVVALQRLEVA